MKGLIRDSNTVKVNDSGKIVFTAAGGPGFIHNPVGKFIIRAYEENDLLCL